MKVETRIAIATFLLTVAIDAMAQPGGPRRVTYALGGAAIGGLLGFLAGLWWCRRCHEKKKLDADKIGLTNDK